MIHKNLTPFFWGPRITSRKPPQPEMAVCVRAVFAMLPGQPLVAIEDPIQQGFMSGDTFAQDDIDQRGALLRADDFADWKLHGEVLLNGTCHAPGGSAPECNVRFAVGAWSKTLRVVGPRVWKPGMLLGGTLSEPQPFARMPLTWQNAYGGEGYAQNPVGRGYADVEMPTVELPDAPVTKKGKSGVTPATFLPISPHWPQRAGKRGRKYDATWKRTRAPFFAEDFDWTSMQAAAPDQWLDGYLRGDEDVVFENLHPTAARWQTKLPGIRIRAFVKTTDGAVREPEMHLDTLHADCDAGKLTLVWRGHAPVQEIDLTDVAVVLIAQEKLADAPKPFAEYEAQLLAFEDDPVGLKGAFSPGFMAVADAVAAAELAERNGEPMPDLKKVAASLPADCPFPPWFLAAVAGEEDPLGVKAAFPPGMLDGDDPLGLKAKVGDLGDSKKVEHALEDLPKLQQDPTLVVPMMQRLAALLPPEQQPAMLASIAALQKDFATLKASGPAVELAAEPATPAPAAAAQAALIAQADAAAAAAGVQLGPLPSLDDVVARTLAPLDSIVLPELPPIPDTEADLAKESAKLQAQEAQMKRQHGDHPLLGLFALGHRLIAKAPRPADVAPDLSPIAKGLGRTHAALLAQGITAAALAPLGRLTAKVEALVAKIPQRPPAPKGDFAQQNLQQRDFSRRQLRGMVFTRSDLSGATFAGSDLTGADFRQCNLTGADFTGANLTDADLSACTLHKAKLGKATALRVRLVDSDLGGADLTGADCEGAHAEQVRMVKANLHQARFVGADLRFADLSKSDLTGADLSDADLSLATVALAKGDGAVLARIAFDMARFTKSRLRGANLAGARSSMGSLGGCDLTGADLRGCKFEKVDCMAAVLDGADCEGADLRQCILRDVHAVGASFRKALLTGASVTGKSTFAKSSFVGADGTRSTWMDADLSHADFRRSTFRSAYFQGSFGDAVNFEAADCSSACFRRANLRQPSFAHTNLASADFNRARLDGASFRAANCYDAKFLDAQAVGSDFQDAFVVGLQLTDPAARKP